MSTAAQHTSLLAAIIEKSGKPTQHTFLDSYLGNSHPRYPISTPALRAVAKSWIKTNPLTPKQFVDLITALVDAPSSTEKTTAGILMDYANDEQLGFDPLCFDRWLNPLAGWAQIDALCYGHFSAEQVLENWKAWKKLLLALAANKNINKRRAALVLLCKPLTRSNDEGMRKLAFHLVDTLKHEKEIPITKAISWLLRSMVKQHKKALIEYVTKNKSTLPAIAVRETLTKIRTGKKTLKK